MKDPSVLEESRGKVENPEGALVAAEGRLEDVRILEISLFAGRPVDSADSEATTVRMVEQRRKNRLRVEARQAAPDDIAGPFDERRELTVTDESQVFQPHPGKLPDWIRVKTVLCSYPRICAERSSSRSYS
jgi:hypothetical protein